MAARVLRGVGLALVACAGLLAAQPTAEATAAGTTAGGAAAAAAVTASGGTLNAVPAQRVLDTRTATGGHHGKLAGGATMRLRVLGGGGVPGAGVSAVLLNVTALDETAGSGYLTVFQTGISRPSASTLDYRGGVAVANQALVRVGHDGTISIFNSAGTTDVTADVEGWVGTDAATAAGQVTTMTPARILDTRSAGGHGAPLANGQSLTLPVAGAGQVPAGVAAVYADITALPVGNSAGYLTAYPGGTAAPPVSTVTFTSGVTTANLALLPVSAAGTITVTNRSPAANVIVDIAGWVSGGDVTADAGTQATPVTRIVDTRGSLGGHRGPVGPGAVVSVQVAGAGGVPAAGVAAVIVHITAVQATLGTSLTAYAAGYPRPAGSMLSVGAGGAVSATVIVPVGPAGAISVYNALGRVNVLIDMQGWIAAPVLTVVPPSAAALGAGPLTTADGRQALSILANANRYAMTTWWSTVYPALNATPLTPAAMPALDDVQRLTYSAITAPAPDPVRRLSIEAFSLATSIATGAYDPAATGVPTATATARTIAIIGHVVAGHLTSMPGGWGGTSGSMSTAAYLGTAAWLLWPDLTPQVQSQVARMVYLEAESGMGQRLQFYVNAAGTLLQYGDTGADQDSWFPMCDQLAIVMMPGNPHVPLWGNAVVRDAIVAWSRPPDDTNATVVNGATVAGWIADRGSNVLRGGDLYNHRRIAPDYSTLIHQNMQDILLTALAGQPAPQAVRTLVAPVYAAYTTVRYPSPPDLRPGGTVYRASSAVYYPQGSDWGTGQEIPYALVDAETAAFGVGTRTSAAYESLHAGAELALQQAHADGHTYDSDAQYRYVGREEHVAQEAAQLYLTMFVRDHALSSFTSSSYWLAP